MARRPIIPDIFPSRVAGASPLPPAVPPPGFCDVRSYGARGDGTTLDTPSIRLAIEDPGCGTVVFSRAPSADAVYLTGSVRLQSHLTLLVPPGVTLRGANASVYDLPEPNPFDGYQDYGHSHWHNAMIWGDSLVNVTLAGGGALDGGGGLGDGRDMPDGYGDKLLSLKSCQGVSIRDLSLRRTGHFAVLATNVSQLDMRRLQLSPTRDGVDLVGCRDVYASELTISGGGDDAFVLKSDYSLGAILPTRNVTLRASDVSTVGATALEIGSETVGDFDSIRFLDCRVRSAGDGALGMAIMDGGRVSDVEYRNITITGAASPIQFYIGARQTGHPENVGRRVGAIHNVRVVDVRAFNMSNHGHPGPPRNWTAMLDGQPAIETIHVPASSIGPNVTLERVSLTFRGGGSAAGGAALEPPHPPRGWSNTGPWPSWGFFLRQTVGVTLRDVSLAFEQDDGRPALALEEAPNTLLDGMTARRGAGASFDVLVRHGCPGTRIVGGNVTANRSRARL